jgi:26S proteasome regulatory subunit T1
MAEKDEKVSNPVPLDDQDITLLKRYGMGPYADAIKLIEEENRNLVTTINKLVGIKESDTGLSLPS